MCAMIYEALFLKYFPVSQYFESHGIVNRITVYPLDSLLIEKMYVWEYIILHTRNSDVFLQNLELFAVLHKKWK